MPMAARNVHRLQQHRQQQHQHQHQQLSTRIIIRLCDARVVAMQQQPQPKEKNESLCPISRNPRDEWNHFPEGKTTETKRAQQQQQQQSLGHQRQDHPPPLLPLFPWNETNPVRPKTATATRTAPIRTVVVTRRTITRAAKKSSGPVTLAPFSILWNA